MPFQNIDLPLRVQPAQPLNLDIGCSGLRDGSRWVFTPMSAHNAWCEIVFGGLPGCVEFQATDPDPPYHALLRPEFVNEAIADLSQGRIEPRLAARIATQTDGRPRAAQVLMVHLDLDDYWTAGQDKGSAFWERLATLGLPPTFCALGDGWDLYWRLDQPMDHRNSADLRWYESSSQRLAQALGGKSHDSPASRWIKPPWTEASPDPYVLHVEMEEYWPDRVYSWESIDQILDQHKCSAGLWARQRQDFYGKMHVLLMREQRGQLRPENALEMVGELNSRRQACFR